MRRIKREGTATVIQILCSVVFLTVSITSVSMNTGRAVLAHLPERKAERQPETESTLHTEPSEPTEAATAEEPPADEEGSVIVPVELSLADGSGDILFKNETDYTFDTSALLSSGYPIEPVGEEPSVLILHTHATECYTEEGRTHVTSTRSSDTEKNMINVGEAIAEGLEAQGVGVIHCTVMHDAESYSEAYIRSKETVMEYLEQYPTLKYVIDVHRDAISTGDGGMAKPVITKDGQSLAQLMLVVGTDEGGADHPGWKTNLSVAVRTQAALAEYDPSLVRPINLRSASFNQQLCEGFLLLEVGSCANTMEEATASGSVFADVFAKLIKNP